MMQPAQKAPIQSGNGSSQESVLAQQASERVVGSVVEWPELLLALERVRDGDFSVRLPICDTGIAGRIADTFNEIVSANERMAAQLERVGQVVGREGRTRQRVRFAFPHGAWGDMEAVVSQSWWKLV